VPLRSLGQGGQTPAEEVDGSASSQP